MWQNLIDGGARFSCAITVLAGDVWECPQDAVVVLDQDDLDRLREILRMSTDNRVQVRHRSFCPTHKTTVEGYLNPDREW